MNLLEFACNSLHVAHRGSDPQCPSVCPGVRCLGTGAMLLSSGNNMANRIHISAFRGCKLRFYKSAFLFTLVLSVLLPKSRGEIPQSTQGPLRLNFKSTTSTSPTGAQSFLVGQQVPIADGSELQRHRSAYSCTGGQQGQGNNFSRNCIAFLRDWGLLEPVGAQQLHSWQLLPGLPGPSVHRLGICPGGPGAEWFPVLRLFSVCFGSCAGFWALACKVMYRRLSF